ncbi:MAG TPA: tetratricopeptide repeat protein [Burkholderiales bacterium]|nr:tetratricopeptide repeat protein [Burkholderiales bacterium]
MVLLAAALTAAAPSAFPQPPQTRAEALGALVSPDAATRAEAVVWLANRGGMEDAPLLHERLRDESSFVRGFAEQGLWLLWSRSGDAEIDRLMALGTEAMQAGRHSEAIGIFSRIIERKSEFAEGWNRRATVYYLAGEYDKSITDCHEVLKRNPRHFGALSGMGQIYVQLEDYENALRWYRRALEVNPNMLGVEMNIRLLEEKLKDRRAPGRST